MIKSFLGYFQRMRIPTRKEIREYYPKYLMAHRNPVNKLMHIFGNLLTVAFIVSVTLCSFKISFLFLPLFILTPFVVYIGAWPGHKLFEKNKPATFYMNPLLTKTCDWVMMKDLVTGKIALNGNILKFPQELLDFSQGSSSLVRHVGYIRDKKNTFDYELQKLEERKTYLERNKD